jgi:ubiquinone/menaquinone biosynthesis C-methylase UbiE
MQTNDEHESTAHQFAEALVSKVFLESTCIREAFNRVADYEKIFVNWLLGPILRCIATEIHERLKKGTLLDVGCGPGNLLLEIHRLNSGLRLVGTDISKSKIHKAQKNAGVLVSDRIRFLLNRPAELPFENESFEMVVSTFAFHIWTYPLQMLNEVHRVLRPKGEFIIYNFNGSRHHREQNFGYFAACAQKAPPLARKVLLWEARFGYHTPGYHYYTAEEIDQLARCSLFQEADIRPRAVLDSNDHFLVEARLTKQ